MKSSELRLGNLFTPINRSNPIHLPTGAIFKIRTIGFSVGAIPFDKLSTQIESFTEFQLRDLSEITITDDWLLNFGFQSFPWGWVKKSTKGFSVRLNIKTFSYEVDGNPAVKLEYVHQLQNLYFILTGEELEFS